MKFERENDTVFTSPGESAALGYGDLPMSWVLSESWLLRAIKNSRLNLQMVSLEDSISDAEQIEIQTHLSTLESMQWELGVPIEDLESEVNIRDFQVRIRTCQPDDFF